MGLKKSLLLGTSLLLATTSLSARPIDSSFYYDDMPSNIYYDEDRPEQNGKIRLKEYIDQYHVGQNTLKVRQLLRMTKQYKGHKVKKVIIFAASDHGRGKAQLLINGTAASSQQILGQYLEKHVFKVPAHQNILGEDIRSLQIKLNGRIEVEKLVAVLEKPTRDQGRRVINVTEEIFQSFRNYDYVPLDSKLHRHQGKKLLTVTVRGESRRGNGKVQLLVNGEPQGYPQRLSEFSDKVVLKLDSYTPSVLGRDIETVELEVTGRVFIEDAVLKLQKRGNGPVEPPRKRKVKKVVLKEFFGPTQVGVAQLADLISQDKKRSVRRVEIKATSLANRARVQLMGMSGRLGAHRVNYDSSLISWDTHGEKARDLKLKIGGDLEIETITVIFDN